MLCRQPLLTFGIRVVENGSTRSRLVPALVAMFGSDPQPLPIAVPCRNPADAAQLASQPCTGGLCLSLHQVKANATLLYIAFEIVEKASELHQTNRWGKRCGQCHPHALRSACVMHSLADHTEGRASCLWQCSHGHSCWCTASNA